MGEQLCSAVLGVDLRRLSRLVPRALLVTAMVASGACSHSPPAATIDVSPCRVGEQPVAARCASLEVPENRKLEAGRRIPIRFAVLPASSGIAPRSPLLILVGGPGQAATVSGVPIAQVLSRARRHRDVVLVDQRGTGGSHPLGCHDEDVPFNERLSKSPSVEEILECLRSLDADTTQYTTQTALEDYEEVRRALGYTRWSLWGGSYGTRVALAYMQAYPASVERVVLDGVAPTDIELPLHFAEDGAASLDKVFEDCRTDAACGRAFPQAKDLVPALLTKLGEAGIDVPVTHPSRGTPERVKITRDGFLGGIRTLLYSSDLSALLPYALDQAHHHDHWTPFVTAVTALADLMSEQVNHFGMYLSVMCSEDVARISSGEVAEAAKIAPFGASLVTQAQTWCKTWPTANLKPEYYAPVQTEHPTLILSGGHDPATPPRWGRLTAQRLPNSLHVEVAAASHGVTSLGCAPEVIDEFLSSKAPKLIATQCLDEVVALPYFTRATGP